MAPSRTLFAGFDVSALTLGGAALGAIDAEEAQAILGVAAAAGITLVDTSSAYGASEAIIGHSAAELSVATKFGNPCGLNDHKHDYSVAHCAQVRAHNRHRCRRHGRLHRFLRRRVANPCTAAASPIAGALPLP